MKNNIFSQSLAKLKNPRSLVITAMLTAVMIVLDQPFLSLQIGNGLKINFLFIPVMICGMFYGPVPCAAMCVAGDVLGVLLTGKGVVWQLILVELVRGILIGCIMFKKEPTLGRVVAGQSVSNLFVNMCLNTAVLMWVGYLPSQNIFLAAGARVVKNIVFLPVEIIALFFLLNSLIKAMEKNRLRP